MTDAVHPAHDQDIPAFWRSLGLPGLADIHVHFLPDAMQQKVWSYFDDAEQNYGRPWPIRYRWPVEERLEFLRGIGVRRIPALTYPHKPGMAAWLNQWNAELAAAYPEVIHCGTFYPEPEAAGYVGEALASGARLFKTHVQVGEYDPADAWLTPVWDQLERAQVPVVAHAGSAPLKGTYTGTERIRRVLADHPRLVLVIAHMGMPEYHGFADIAEEYENVHLDTTIVFTELAEYFAPVPEDYIGRLGALKKKIVLGTDFPTIPHTYAEQLRVLRALDLGDDWLRHVLWHNGARLLGLDE
ncbi:amidohydrolase family protein [Sediminivirga luteola]|uniref:Amidohydrolase n=1 Tax=Sediminivirga luteola TaxID=1774748 RepID=A0A8J2U0T1_9MICO|nr:amidohydrolase family protein [Sediminivirga luteola]MCI2264547.1 amidohydrolase family protein [Sediminivirga luteola]GGA26003.1 amidohydrolase [Sediminivirga luteola]